MLTCDEVTRLLSAPQSGRQSSDLRQALAVHLSRCEKCQRALITRHPEAAAEKPDSLVEKLKSRRRSISQAAYAGVLDRVLHDVLEEGKEIENQRAAAPILFAELADLPFSRQDLLIQNSRRYHIWALAEHLLSHAREASTEDPYRSEEFAHVAVKVAEKLRAKGFRAQLLNDLKAEAWSCVANCRRIRSDYYEALKAFQEAEHLLSEGSGDRLERARLLDLKASLFVDRGDFELADQLLTAAIEEYRGTKERHFEGRALMKRARILRRSGRVHEAIPVLLRAMSLIDIGRELWLDFALKKNLVIYLVEAGRPEEAQSLLREVRELAKHHANRLERLRLHWTEGLVCKALDQVEFAVEALKQAREGFIAAGIGFDVALISLDLAALYLETGRTEEVRKLATEIVPLFASRGTHREVVMAWNLFREAAKRDAVTLRLVEELASRIRNAEPRGAWAPETP